MFYFITKDTNLKILILVDKCEKCDNCDKCDLAEERLTIA